MVFRAYCPQFLASRPGCFPLQVPSTPRNIESGAGDAPFLSGFVAILNSSVMPSPMAMISDFQVPQKESLRRRNGPFFERGTRLA